MARSNLPRLSGHIVPIDLLPDRGPGWVQGTTIEAKKRPFDKYHWLVAPNRDGELQRKKKYAVFVDKWNLQVRVNWIPWTNSFLARNILRFYYQDISRVEFLYPHEFPNNYKVVKYLPAKYFGKSYSAVGKYYAPNELMVRLMDFSGNKRYLRQVYDYFMFYVNKQIEDSISLYTKSGIKFKNLDHAYEVVVLRNVLIFTTFNKGLTTLLPGEYKRAFELLNGLRDKYFKYLM